METSIRKQLEYVCADLLGDTPARIIQTGHINPVPGQKFRIVESLISERQLQIHFREIFPPYVPHPHLFHTLLWSARQIVSADQRNREQDL